MIRTFLCAAALVGAAQAGAAECGRVDPCQIDAGEYRIALPDTVTPETPVLVFLHGYGGSGKGTMNNRRLVPPMLARGWAVIAPEGLRRRGDGPKSWQFRPGFGTRDERAFFRDVVADAAERFGVSSDKVMLSGFSAGGFMVSYLACETPDTFAAYAPVSGGFWRPMPESCAGPVRLFHTHGWTDKTVPLEGRKLGGGSYQQGDIFAGMELWRAANGCSDQIPTGFATTGPYMRRRWSGCSEGSALEFALHPGGHTLPGGWADMIVDWFDEATATTN